MTVEEALAALRKKGTAKGLASLVRFGITATNPLGLPMTDIKAIAKEAKRDHALAARLWETNVYEARLLAAFVEVPSEVTSAQMDRWARAFDNWAICDHHCFHLFDRTAHAWEKVPKWAKSKHEFVKRAAFALIASLALHRKNDPNDRFLEFLPLIEAAADDPRNFVKKGVSWGLRGIGHRNPEMRKAALALAARLAESPDPTSRWVGKDAIRDLSRKA
jgi:3-methyladenine DNA glycosylase AlkD